MERDEYNDQADIPSDEVTEFAYAPPPRVPGPQQPEEHEFKDWALI